MWRRGWRDETWSRLAEPWELVIIGGGITGAGILSEASRRGVRALLLEQRDFAWGTSSRSSKLVHGGLRYLQQAEIALLRAAARERERLLSEAPGLVERLGFLAPARREHGWRREAFGVGLALYDLLGGRWCHRRHELDDFCLLAPHVSRRGLQGGFSYDDAVTDDARLVLRLIREAVARGAAALSYARVESLLRVRGRVAGIGVRDTESGRTAEVRAPVVINATGAWADGVRRPLGAPARLRPLRGSHLVFPAWRLPAAQALMFLHPRDQRPLFVVPWEGATLVGTTDLDHERPLDEEARISSGETAYLIEALRSELPDLDLEPGDAVASFAGVRPVVGSGRADPSSESREHALWDEAGLLTVAGGKLTTFPLIARQALEVVANRLPSPRSSGAPSTVLSPPRLERLEIGSLGEWAERRVVGRYGSEAGFLLSAAGSEERQVVPGTRTLWAELLWAARAEGVVHLDDLLLRRVRLGLLLPDGGLRLAPRIRTLCQHELGWDDARWRHEEERYRSLWHACYAPPLGRVETVAHELSA